MLDYATDLINAHFGKDIPEGVTIVGDVLRARRGADVWIVYRPWDWSRTLPDLLGEDAFIHALSNGARAAALCRGFAHVRIEKSGTLTLREFYVSHRTGRELARAKPKRRFRIESAEAVPLQPQHGLKGGRRPGSSITGSEARQ